MRFLCTKVKGFWLTSAENVTKVHGAGLSIKSPFIGIEIHSNQPSEEEYNKINKAIDLLFEENKKAFPVRLLEI